VARAGTTTAFTFGDSITRQQANYYDWKTYDSKVTYTGNPTATNAGKTVSVGSYPSNAFGLHEVHGNVWEWTEDCWNGSYTGAPAEGSAWASGDCGQRVLRGGSWNDDPYFARSTHRYGLIVGNRTFSLGFRVARTD
jgi:formylglycine-generating enzyme required for sulfatase activity